MNKSMNPSIERLIELHRQFSDRGLSVKEMREYDTLTRTNLDSLINAYILVDTLGRLDDSPAET